MCGKGGLPDPARLAAGRAVLVAGWLVFSCAAASLQEAAGSAGTMALPSSEEKLPGW